jgi:hypothetical protein
MLEKSPNDNVIYVGYFDNIRFSGPETLSTGESTSAIYTSTNDFFGFRSVVFSSGKVVLSWLGGGILEEPARRTGTGRRSLTRRIHDIERRTESLYRLRR